MSIREFLDENKNFNYSKIKTSTMDIAGIVHEKLNNKYTIHDNNGNHLLAFDYNNQLTESTLKDYCDVIKGTVQEMNTTQTSSINAIQRQLVNHTLQLTNHNELLQSTATTSNITQLQTQVANLQSQMDTLIQYMESMKIFMGKFKQAVFIEDPVGSGIELNYTNLI